MTDTELFEPGLVREGSTLLLHSSIKRLFRRTRARPQQIIEYFLEALGSEGTLLLPLFNFEFTKGEPFDIRETPSHMGPLTEIGRTWPSARRTGHPIYSFAAIGKQAELFAEIDNRSAYGADSPFAKLIELDGDIGVIDLPDQESMTTYHHVEEMKAVSYRFQKEFKGEYTGWHGETSERTYGIYVRNLDKGVLTSVDRMGERLWDKGLYRGERPGEGHGLRVIRARDLFDETAAVIDAGDAENYLFEYGE